MIFSFWAAINKDIKVQHSHLFPHIISDLNILTSCQPKPARDGREEAERWPLANKSNSEHLNIVTQRADANNAQPRPQFPSTEPDCQAVG